MHLVGLPGSNGFVQHRGKVYNSQNSKRKTEKYLLELRDKLYFVGEALRKSSLWLPSPNLWVSLLLLRALHRPFFPTFSLSLPNKANTPVLSQEGPFWRRGAHLSSFTSPDAVHSFGGCNGDHRRRVRHTVPSWRNDERPHGSSLGRARRRAVIGGWRGNWRRFAAYRRP